MEGREGPVPDRRVQLIYIAGSGRSGSTLLDLLLGRHPRIAGVGEFTRFSDWLAHNDPCTCGAPVRECAYWLEILGDVGEDGLPVTSFGRGRAHTLRLFARWVRGRPLPPRLQGIARENRRLLAGVARATGAEWIVDSSKDPGRLFALLASGLFDVRVLHLVRDGRGVAYSRTKPRASKVRIERLMERGPARRTVGRTTRRWIAINLLLLGARLRLPDERYRLVRYEDLAERPESEMRRIYEFCGLEPRNPLENGADRTAHNIGGNAIRFDALRRIRVDDAWRRKLSRRNRWVFALHGGNLMNWLARQAADP